MRLAVDVERAVLVVVSVDGFSRRQTASLTNERSVATDGLTISALLTCQGGQRRPRRCCDELGMKGIHAGAEWVGDKKCGLSYQITVRTPCTLAAETVGIPVVD